MTTTSITKNLHHDSVAERIARGKAARARVPRASHAQWSSVQRQFEPLDLLVEQALTRVEELVPIRHGRMAASPFAYFRGAAYPMAADLSGLPRTDLEVQLCGDAHLSNFGGFASPERNLIFDVNDFDETAPGPFEWDVKRLAASIDIAARGRDFTAPVRNKIVAKSVATYREAIREFAGMRRLDIWYARLDVQGILDRWASNVGADVLATFQRVVTKARSKDRLKAAEKLTHVVDGEMRIISDPPLIVPVEEVFSTTDAEMISDIIHEALRLSRNSLPADRRRLLESYRFVHLARKVVGVGSVGTRAWLALMLGRDDDDPLFLQVKQAEASVLERFAGASPYSHHGERVVEGQRLMQAVGDIFLGWTRVPGDDGVKRDFYMRQLWDWKASADVDVMSPEGLALYGRICGWTLARAHARSGDSIAIGSYLGGSDSFDRAVTEFAHAYADQNALDHQSLVDAIADGAVPAETGV